MIQKLKVKGLNGRFDYNFEFYSDLNLFTGHIGTGKTTLLKLIWLLTSGNLHRVFYEIPFQTVSIETSHFSLSMDQNDFKKVEFSYQFGKESSTEFVLDIKPYPLVSEVLKQLEKLNKRIADMRESSLFFPTFRRIERHLPEISESLSLLAEELSVEGHRFIMAVSTYDIIDMLSRIHARIKNKNQVDNESETCEQSLPFLINYDPATLVERWDLLNQLAKEIFTDYEGIRITEDIVLGVAVSRDSDPIPSPNLSSGEKQLLGFLCYNGFSGAKTIFIDEPELSLHPDWQRLIIGLLKLQGTEKQFFIASHSPYIGLQYEDKSFRLDRTEED